MNKLEVGLYVRTKKDGIGKIISLSIGEEDECCFIELSNRRTGIKEHNIIKSSYNIIDLIEVGDFVNGFKIDNIGYNYLISHDSDGDIEIFNENIKSVVTKEMFKQMKYEVE